MEFLGYEIKKKKRRRTWRVEIFPECGKKKVPTPATQKKKKGGRKKRERKKISLPKREKKRRFSPLEPQ